MVGTLRFCPPYALGRATQAGVEYRKLIKHGSGKDHMSWLASTMETTANLPLKDTAFFFFMRRHELDFEENSGSTWRDHGTAREGSTFRRLRTLFPRATDQDLENALDAAAMFWRDCERQVDFPSGIDQALFVAEMVDRARQDNPDFADATIEEARHQMWRITR